MKKNHVLWITRTAVLIALVISVQAVTSAFAVTPLVRQLITGSIVNTVLIIAVMAANLSTGLAVGLVSPVFAVVFGVVPGWQWPLVPMIAVGNAVIALSWHFVSKVKITNTYAVRIIALVTGAVCKFAVLYVGVVKIMIPLLSELSAPQVTALSSAFSVTQLFTAAIGGVLAILGLPVIAKAVGGRR